RRCKQLNKEIIVEKTPVHIHKIDKIFTLFKNAKIILMMRDGRDVACSIRERTGNFEKGIERWIVDNSVGFNYWNDPRVKVIKLEDLTEYPSDVLKQTCDFIGIDFESEMIQGQGKKEKLYYTDKIPTKND